MSRQTAILGGLAVVLVAIAYYFFLWQPKSDQVAEIEDQIEQQEAQQIELQQRINALQDIRDRAPELEAAIVAAESIVPRDIAVPAALRQLVLAADDSGVDLVSVSPARPAAFTGADEPGVAVIDVSLQVNGGYFQLIDFLRRIEDPSISPRGFVWTGLSLSPSDYPTLAANITGSMFAVLPVSGAPETTPAPVTEQEDDLGTDEEVTP